MEGWQGTFNPGVIPALIVGLGLMLAFAMAMLIPWYGKRSEIRRDQNQASNTNRPINRPVPPPTSDPLL